MPPQKMKGEKAERSSSPAIQSASSRRQLTFFAAAFLVVATLVTFWQVRQCDFINYDDPEYVYENPHVQSGLTGQNITWAFTAQHSSNWHPLTWISHMIDVQMHGMDPGGHHFTSLLLHTANVLLLFLLLNRTTGALWRSAMVAGLFAVHPLRVESVAWISERKDVLSGLFFLLTLLAWVSYVEKIKARKPAKWFYGMALLFFAGGLMSKPMLVTLPVILLLLDFWPLRRVTGDTWRVAGKTNNRSLTDLLLEKIPFAVLSLISSRLTYLAQEAGGSVRNLEEFPLQLRLENAVVSCVLYIRKMFWPNDLALFYPHPKAFPTWLVLVALALLIALTFFAIRLAQKKSFILVGWLWFLVMLLPVIGLVQVGIQAMADRYTYLPMIGLYVLIVWSIAEIKIPTAIQGGIGAVALAGCFFFTRHQVGFWRNNETIYHHSLAVTTNNYVATENLGIALGRLNRLEESEKYLRTARDMFPEYAEANHNLGNGLHRLNRDDEAIACYKEAIRLKPDYADSMNNWGFICARAGRFEEALGLYAQAERITPNDAIVHYNMGAALVQLNRVNEAVKEYLRALELNPDMPQVHFQLAAIYAANDKRSDAIVHLQEALRLKPDYVEAQQQLDRLSR